MSTIAPVAVGVALAFTWNVAESHTPGAAGASSAVTPEVEMTVEQAAAQVWASASPLAVTAGAVATASPLAPGGGNGAWPSGHAHASVRHAPRPHSQKKHGRSHSQKKRNLES